MSLRLTILGSGTSHGIPMIGCGCAVCTSDDPRDRRTRAGAVFSFDGGSVLIDTPPELRLQCLACAITRIDAIAYTHAHADHVAGLDDVRIFNQMQREALNVYASADTLARVREMFGYAFTDDPDYPSAKPTLHGVTLTGPVEVCGQTLIPIPYAHGPTEVLGFRIGDIAYCPDCSHIPDRSLELLTDLDVLVLDALRRRPHPTHLNLEQAVELAARIGARRTVFTHIAHELLHAETQARLPAGMELGWDGLVCESGS